MFTETGTRLFKGFNINSFCYTVNLTIGVKDIFSFQKDPNGIGPPKFFFLNKMNL